MTDLVTCEVCGTILKKPIGEPAHCPKCGVDRCSECGGYLTRDNNGNRVCEKCNYSPDYHLPMGYKALYVVIVLLSLWFVCDIFLFTNITDECVRNSISVEQVDDNCEGHFISSPTGEWFLALCGWGAAIWVLGGFLSEKFGRYK